MVCETLAPLHGKCHFKFLAVQDSSIGNNSCDVLIFTHFLKMGVVVVDLLKIVGSTAKLEEGLR